VRAKVSSWSSGRTWKATPAERAGTTHAEDFVRFRDFFELLRGLLAALVAIGVVLECELLVRALDGVVVGVATDAESLVKVCAHVLSRGWVGVSLYVTRTKAAVSTASREASDPIESLCDQTVTHRGRMWGSRFGRLIACWQV
jgi:hypothetical protein